MNSAIWKFLASLGIFLFGMKLVEDRLDSLSGRSFKLLLRKYTASPLMAVLCGVVATVVIQSSSVIGLIVLTLVGAEIIKLRSALGIIVGTNLGTTATGWLVAYFGFSVEIDKIIMPLLAVGCLAHVLLGGEGKLKAFTGVVVGFGFLLFGLGLMKDSVPALGSFLDFSQLSSQSPHSLAVVGFVATAIIQSSSAMMAVVMSALDSGFVTLEGAAAMVIGSDLGTTITVVLGALGGSAIKKRVAVAHVAFNFIVDSLSLVALYPLLQLVQFLCPLEGPVYTLVGFHSTFNALGVIIFFPFLGVFANFLENLFQNEEEQVSRFISNVPPEMPDLGLIALEKELSFAFEKYIFFARMSLGLELTDGSDSLRRPFFRRTSLQDLYIELKDLGGELTEYQQKLVGQRLSPSQLSKLGGLEEVKQQLLLGSKCLKDIQHNIDEFDKSVDSFLQEFMELLRRQQDELYQAFLTYFRGGPDKASKLPALEELITRNYQELTNYISASMKTLPHTDVEVSTLFNVAREQRLSNRSTFGAMKSLVETNTA